MPAPENFGQPSRQAGLDERFDSAIDACVRGAGPAALLFSGGVDSAIVALALRGRVPFDALAIGLPGSRDLRQASSAARLLDIPLTSVELTGAEVRRSASEMIRIVGKLREPLRSVQLSLALALRATKRPVVLTGQGADELFGGYGHFRDLAAEEAEARRSADLAQLLERDWPMTLEIGRAFGRELRSPFLDPSFLAYARALPLPPMRAGDPSKPVLREWAVHRGLPREVAERPKLAIQYGTGIARLLRAGPASGLGTPRASARRAIERPT